MTPNRTIRDAFELPRNPICFLRQVREMHRMYGYMGSYRKCFLSMLGSCSRSLWASLTVWECVWEDVEASHVAPYLYRIQMRSCTDGFEKGLSFLCACLIQWEGDRKTMRCILTCYGNLTGFLISINNITKGAFWIRMDDTEMNNDASYSWLLLSAYPRKCFHARHTCTSLLLRKPEI